MTNSVPGIKYGLTNPQDGISNQKARLIVLDMKTGQEVVTSDPSFLVVTENESFFNEPFVPAAQIRSQDWNNHAVYYGLTISRNKIDGTDRGAVYRLQMVDTEGNPLPVKNWKLKKFINTDRPVSGAVNSTYDSLGQLWVLFGTGRLWSTEDTSPCRSHNTKVCQDNHQQYLFGLKENLNVKGYMTFSDRTLEAKNILDLSGATVMKDGTVKNIIYQPLLLRTIGGAASYTEVKAATGKATIVGYKRKFEIGKILEPSSTHNYEMLLSQPKLVTMGEGESLMSFTSFEPSSSDCGVLGQGYQYAVDTFTGLPSPSTKQSFFQQPNAGVPKDVVTGAISTGEGKPTESVVLSFDGKLIIRTASSDGNIFDIEVANPASKLTSGQTSWREVLDMGLEVPKPVMSKDL
jgi:hypothetical protein